MNRFDRSKAATSIFLLIACTSFLAAPVWADVKLPRIIGSGMVLQRNMPLSIWGWADTGEEVAVQLGQTKVTTKAGAGGKWTVTLPVMQAGGPHKITISGKNTIRLENVLVGDVWICSGQSNMAFGLSSAEKGKEAVDTAGNANIRLFDVPRRTSSHREEDVDATWLMCTPDTVKKFSAVGYFFGRRLQKELNIPIGLIGTSWGGTRIEPWTPLVGFASVPKTRIILKDIEKSNDAYRQDLAKSFDPMETWIKDARKALSLNKPLPPQPDFPSSPFKSPRNPVGIYNGMVNPLTPFAIRGAIWYQGESNLSDGMMYHEKMKALISGWRKVWGQGDFPFYFVQLAPYKYGQANPRYLPRIWEAQTATLSVPNTGMAVTVDIGNINDIHPRNKRDVGKRLALWALAKTYGQKGIVYSGPLYKSMSIEGDKIRIRFDHVGSGLASRDAKPLNWFEVSGKDMKFVKAKAKIDGETLVVSSETVVTPVAVRFAWLQTAEPNLMNKEGLPASPFRAYRNKPEK